VLYFPENKEEVLTIKKELFYIDSEKSLEKRQPETAFDLNMFCDIFGTELSHMLFNSPEIKPNYILNNEEAFLNFINNPFKVQE